MDLCVCILFLCYGLFGTASFAECGSLASLGVTCSYLE